MGYQRSLIPIFNLILCIYAKSWYLASDNTHINQNQNKIKRFTPLSAEAHATIYRKNYSNTVNGYFIPDVQDFEPSEPMQISTLFKSSTRKAVKEEVKTSSSRPYINTNQTVKNSNIIKRPRRKLLQRRRTQKPKQIHFNLNSIAEGRFLDVFEVVEFDHVPCFSNNGLEGTCLPEYDCQKIGGKLMGTCADGYGICCVIIFACDGRSSYPSGWFTNPGFPMPSSDRLSCTFTLDKYSDQVQQIRLDFMNFEILPPTAGTCELDQFLVTGQNINSVIPILCGINTGQHIYIEVSDTEGPIVLSFQTISEEKRLFSIKVTQIMSLDKLKAPSGCLQYFNEEHGYLESFNYRDTSEIGITRIPSYLNNLNYAICIERAKGSCSITYNNVGDMQIINYDTGGLYLLPIIQDIHIK